MSVPVCHHLKEDGVYCNSPALNGRDYCYFHLNLRGRRLKSARARRCGDNPPLNLPFPEDMHAVQICLAEIMWALAEGRIDHKAAGLILYSLQQTSTNLNQTPRWQGEREAVENSRPLRALSDPDFEKRFGLPANTDLDTLPEPLSTTATNLTPSVILSEEVATATDKSKSRRFAGVRADSRYPERAERVEGDPFRAAEPLAGEANAGQSEAAASPSSRRPPECVPIPADEFADLKMTRAEEMEFFLYCMKFDTLEDEDQLRLAWLRAKRAGKLERNEDERENRNALEAIYSDLSHSGKPEAA